MSNDYVYSKVFQKIDKMTVKEHYENHLGNFYAWMIGDFQEKVREHEAFFQANKITTAAASTLAIDLGAGHGVQSVALAQAGFRVKAIDFNTQLLAALRTNAKGLAVEVIEADMLDYLEQATEKAALICCMGDTLTHLQNPGALEVFLTRMADRLMPGGRIVLSFRDLTAELTGAGRFIPVKSDDTRILTCFLEYHTEYVMVHDILHEKQNNAWVQKVSAYPKLRLSEKQIQTLLEKNNLAVTTVTGIQRLTCMVAEKV